MNDVINKLVHEMKMLNHELTVAPHNKAANRRARKHSMVLGKLCKTFRKESTAHDKG